VPRLRQGRGLPGTVTYSLALQAWCVYLVAAHAIPVHRCAELIEALTGARPSPGFVHSMIAHAAAAVAEANKAIRALIILAHVVCADETPIRAGPGPKQEPFRELLECLRDRQDDVLRFADDLRIPPTSNQAERDLRPARTQQKISGRLRSEQATRCRYAVRGYLDTARKHGISALAAIRDALAGIPWRPPIPGPP
jgi:hypothetical protein